MFIFQLINKLLESKSKIQCDETNYESEKNVEVQDTDGTKIRSITSKKVKILMNINYIKIYPLGKILQKFFPSS